MYWANMNSHSSSLLLEVDDKDILFILFFSADRLYVSTTRTSTMTCLAMLLLCVRYVIEYFLIGLFICKTCGEVTDPLLPNAKHDELILSIRFRFHCHTTASYSCVYIFICLN